MFFVISKLLHFFLIPVVWVSITLFLALVSKSDAKRKKYLFASFFIVMVFGNSFLVDEVFRNYEVKAMKIAGTEHFDYGIVLSGMTKWDSELHRVNFRSNVGRLLQALPLHHKGIVDSLVLSGGDGTAFQTEMKESLALKNYLKSIGFTTEKIILEPDSRNTYENASFSIKKLSERTIDLKSKKILLITSALHMKRSLACFEKQGITCIPFVTSRQAGPRKYVLDHLFIPNAESMHAWRAFLHEVLGFAIYFLMDYI